MINDDIREIAKAISEAVPVEQIYLFGSYAYGTPGNDSDYDFFVVIPDGVMRPMEAMQRAQGAVENRKVAVDILANTKSLFVQLKHFKASIEREVDRKGILLYDRG